jgi:hypothetical protein
MEYHLHACERQAKLALTSVGEILGGPKFLSR